MKETIATKEDALIVVDVQRDFCPNGALPTFEGDKIVPVLNRYIEKFRKAKALVVATRDWHPPNHISFKAQGGLWPPHCVQGTKGAEFHPNLKLPKYARIVSKAVNPSKEAYSGFDGTDLAEELKALGIKRVFVGGLATDYCVKNTVLDALRNGFEAVLLEDAVKGINVKPDDSEKAMEEMIENGTGKMKFEDLE